MALLEAISGPGGFWLVVLLGLCEVPFCAELDEAQKVSQCRCNQATVWLQGLASFTYTKIHAKVMHR